MILFLYQLNIVKSDADLTDKVTDEKSKSGEVKYNNSSLPKLSLNWGKSILKYPGAILGDTFEFVPKNFNWNVSYSNSQKETINKDIENPEDALSESITELLSGSASTSYSPINTVNTSFSINTTRDMTQTGELFGMDLGHEKKPYLTSKV